MHNDACGACATPARVPQMTIKAASITTPERPCRERALTRCCSLFTILPAIEREAFPAAAPGGRSCGWLLARDGFGRGRRRRHVLPADALRAEREAGVAGDLHALVIFGLLAL